MLPEPGEGALPQRKGGFEVGGRARRQVTGPRGVALIARRHQQHRCARDQNGNAAWLQDERAVHIAAHAAGRTAQAFLQGSVGAACSQALQRGEPQRQGVQRGTQFMRCNRQEIVTRAHCFLGLPQAGSEVAIGGVLHVRRARGGTAAGGMASIPECTQ